MAGLPAAQAVDMVPRGQVHHANSLSVTSGHQSQARREQWPLTAHREAITIGTGQSKLIDLVTPLADVLISDPATIDATIHTANRIQLIGKRPGLATVHIFDQFGNDIHTFEISVGVNTRALDAMYRRILPGSRIKSEMLNDTIILTGSVQNSRDLSAAVDIAARYAVSEDAQKDTIAKNKVVNVLSIDDNQQVKLRVVIAEVQRDILRQLGINLHAAIEAGQLATAIMTANSFPLTAARGLGSSPLLQPAGTALPGQSGFAVSLQAPERTLATALQALEREGFVRTLSEPTLATLSGEPASFLAGGEYPVPTVGGDGNLGMIFKEFGVGLVFTPVVLHDGIIKLAIEVEASELTSNGSITLNNLQIPALRKRRTKTTVELPSGGAFAIAGLISRDIKNNIDGMPGLKDLPVLGPLFRSKEFAASETELVVIVSARLSESARHSDFDDPYSPWKPASATLDNRSRGWISGELRRELRLIIN